MKRAEKREAEDQITMEELPVGEHQSNGEIENAIQRVQGQIRSMKDAFEARYQTQLEPSHWMIPWLVKYAAAIINRCRVIPGLGITAHHKMKGENS